MDIISRKAILRELLAEYRARKDKAEAEADRVRLRIAEKVPVYADMSGAITRILMDASRRALDDPQNASRIAGEAKERVLRLRAQSENALRAAGYAPEMLEPKYGCPICKDTGFVGTPIHEYCACVKVALMRRLYDEANIGEETFENFDLTVFSDEAEEGAERSQRQVMEVYRAYCEGYADAYPNVKKRNLLLTGRTGLGKTYMLNCIAARVLERGIPVMRLTAYKMLEAMRRYHRGQDDGGLDMMLKAEMLIIDDLGTEPMLENVTVEYLFTLLNERRAGRLPTLIATNLTPQEIKARYTERIFSRLVDRSETEVLRFIGGDVRLHSRAR
jgi:DNA replication protein DnaC